MASNWSDGTKWVMGIVSALIIASLIGGFRMILVPRNSLVSSRSQDVAPPNVEPTVGTHNVTGLWQQPMGPDTYDLEQLGDALEGTFHYADGGRGQLSGEVHGRRVTFKQKGIFNGDPNRPFTADVSLSSDEAWRTLTGTILYDNGEPIKIMLVRQSGGS